jgi:hypothetical protein
MVTSDRDKIGGKIKISKVIVFIVSHFSHFAPKSVMFQNARGVVTENLI